MAKAKEKRLNGDASIGPVRQKRGGHGPRLARAREGKQAFRIRTDQILCPFRDGSLGSADAFHRRRSSRVPHDSPRVRPGKTFSTFFQKAKQNVIEILDLARTKTSTGISGPILTGDRMRISSTVQRLHMSSLSRYRSCFGDIFIGRAQNR